MAKKSRNPRRIGLHTSSRPLFGFEPLLPSDWQKVVEHFQKQAEADGVALVWDDSIERNRIERIRQWYFFSRREEVESIPEAQPDPLSRGRELLAAVAVHLDAVGLIDDGYWDTIVSHCPNLSKKRLDELSVALRDAMKAYDECVAPFQKVRIGESRSFLVNELATLFWEKDLHPTAGNAYRERPKNPFPPFVLVLQLIMLSMPPALRERVSNKNALSKDASRELSKWRQSGFHRRGSRKAPARRHRSRKARETIIAG
jgi:hypothetical protein